MDEDLDALVPRRPCYALGGREVGAAPLTLGRLAAARRFARAFQAALAAPDVLDALAEAGPVLAQEFCVATGIARAEFEAAAADEQIAAGFDLLAALRDFMAGPLTAGLTRGLARIGATPAGAPAAETASDTEADTAADTAAAGPTSPPGSAGAATG